jgi:hypothetical protein
MAKLLDAEWIGGRLERTWSHYGDDGRKKITHEVIQDVEPVMEHAKMLAQNQRSDSAFRFKAHITGTQLEGACRIAAKKWGVSFRECFSEVMLGKTDRAKSVIHMLTDGRDYAKLQAGYWK